MKKLLLASVALLGLAGASTAFAADLPRRAAPPAPAPMIAAVPIFTWTGFYVGVNAGYGWNTNDGSDVFIPGVGFVSNGGSDGGFVGGGQVGYNYQIGQFVLGAEADLQYADLGNDNSNAIVVNGIVIDNGSSNNWFGTVRARAGFAIDRALIYATGGFAYGDVGSSFGGGSTNGGWTIGGGLEYAFTNNITAKIEGLYVNLDRSNNDALLLTSGIVGSSNNNSEFGVVRAGLNFKF